MDFLSVKWLWLYAGALLMLLEIMAPGFVIFFFGLAAATVGLTLFAFDFSATAQMALFTAFSIVYIVGLRRFMKALFMGETAESRAISSEYVGRHGKVVEAMKLFNPIKATAAGTITFLAKHGEVVQKGQTLAVIAT